MQPVWSMLSVLQRRAHFVLNNSSARWAQPSLSYRCGNRLRREAACSPTRPSNSETWDLGYFWFSQSHISAPATCLYSSSHPASTGPTRKLKHSLTRIQFFSSEVETGPMCLTDIFPESQKKVLAESTERIVLLLTDCDLRQVSQPFCLSFLICEMAFTLLGWCED